MNKATTNKSQPLPLQIHLVNGSKTEHVILSPMHSSGVFIGSDFHHSAAFECWDVEFVQHNGSAVAMSSSWKRIA